MDANPDFSAVTTIDLEHSITSLTANINASVFEQLMRLAEFDTRQGWGHEGVRSCAHWLNWRCGISFSAAHEKVRVAHALQSLPQTRVAFASGQLSYSKARAITRIGTVDNEACLLSFARYGTASQLDQTVRLYRRQYEGANALMAGYHQRALPKDPKTDNDVEPAEAECQGALHHRAHRKLDTRWDEFGCLEIRARLTAEQGAVVLKALEAAVESLKEAEPKPEVSSESSPSASRDAAPEANKNSSAEGSAANVDQHRRVDALVLMASQSLESASTNANTADRFQVVVHVDSRVLAGDIHTVPTGEPDCYIEKEVGLPVEVARRLSCSCKIVTALTKGSEPLSIGRSNRAIPTAIQRALAIRDGRCQFPGCGCNKHLDAHHIVHWSKNGETSLDNLILVCHYHHVQLHEGGFSTQRLVTGELRFYKLDGSILSRTAETEPTSAPTVAQDDDAPNTTSPLKPSEAEAWSWNGDSMDYDMALHCIANAKGGMHAQAAQSRAPSAGMDAGSM